MSRELRITLAIMAVALVAAAPLIFAEPSAVNTGNYNYLAVVFHVVPPPTVPPTVMPTITRTGPPTATPTATPTDTPVPPTATKTPVPAMPTATQTSSNCAAEYPTVCIPPPPPDLNCGDITFRRFTVLPPDRHNFDTDNDGIGCEQN
jgi:hypothetical protein